MKYDNYCYNTADMDLYVYAGKDLYRQETALTKLMEKYQITEPAEGTYEAEVFISLAEDITITQPLKVQVKIMKVQ